MSLTENSDQVFLPGGRNRTQNLRFGPYTIMHVSKFEFRKTSILETLDFHIEYTMYYIKCKCSSFSEIL